MPASAWTHILSLELGWMTPGQARRYVESAQEAGLLVADGDLMRLAVDPGNASARLGFRPDPDAAIEPLRAVSPSASADPFVAWVKRVVAATGRDQASVLSDVAQLQERMGGLLAGEVAALWIARDAGLEVSSALQDALERLKPRSTGR